MPTMSIETRQTIQAFLAQYDTLLIATERDHQPFTTGAFYAEEISDDGDITLYFTFIITSRKLANLRDNPKVGVFIGPRQPTEWLEGTGIAQVVDDPQEAERVKQLVMTKSELAGQFMAQVPIAPVRMVVNWARITDLRAGYKVTEFQAEQEVHV